MTSNFKKYDRVLEVLAEREQLYKVLFEDTDDAFQILEIIYDEDGMPTDGIILKMNRTAEELLKVKAEKFCGKRIKEFFPTTEAYWFAEWDSVLKTGRPSHFQNYHFDSDLWLDIFTFPYRAGQVGILFRDVSSAKRLEFDMRFTALTMATNEFIYQLNPDCSKMIQLNSRELKNILEPDENWMDTYIPSGDQALVLSCIQAAIKNKEIFEMEHRVYRQDGSIGWVHSRAVPLLDKNGNIREWFGAANDITNRKIAEEKALHRQNDLSQLVEMKDEFLSIISHEFKTPLNVIFTAVQIMEQRCFNELSAKGKDLLFKIKQNSYRQMRLVNNLLDITRVNAGRMKVRLSNREIVFYTRAITESVEIYAKQKNITIEFSSTMKRKMIAVDEEYYERVLLNLLSNAIKFTQKGKKIQVKLFKKAYQSNPMICLQVIDQGCGIPEDKRKTIFERFGQVDSTLTRQAEGTGIGLTLVKMLVELLGGTIILDSKLGFGSTFSVLLPDRTVDEKAAKNADKFSDSKLVQSIEVEFSDIYLHI